jgi:hypothetical protein
MAKKTDIPKYLPISPVTLVCPECDAKPGKACGTSSGARLEFVHVARIKAAAKLDHANNARRK